MTNAEDRALAAITITRVILREALNDPGVLVQMMAWDVEPYDVEYAIAKILEYLEKTKEEEEAEEK